MTLRGPPQDSNMTLRELISFAATAVALCLITSLLIRYIKFLLNPLRHAKLGPTGGFFVGQFRTIRKEPYMQPHQRWVKEIAGWDAPFLFYTLMFGQPSVLVLDKEIVREILTAPYGKQPLRFVKKIRFLQNILGEGLVTLQGQDWMRHRSIIQPAFFTQALKDTLTKVVPPMTKQLVEHWRLVGEGREIDVASHLSSLTLDVIGRAAFSHEFDALKSVERWAQASGEDQECDTLADLDDPLIRAFTGVFAFNWIGTIAFALNQPWISRNFNRRTIDGRKALDAGVDAVIDNAKKQQVDSSSSNGITNTKSLLQIMMEAHDDDPASKKWLTDFELRDEAKTFIFAGHETTQTWCYHAIYSLCQFHDIQEKVYQDVSKHVKKDEEITLECVENMDYFNAFLQEVLRMYPPIGAFPRASTQMESFGTKYRIWPKTRLLISVYLLHHHPKYWKDPETFLPERWLFKSDEERERFMSDIRFAFIPFSAGGRNCIGQRFATIEAKLILAELIRSFVFKVASSQSDVKFTLTSFVALKTKPRLKVIVKERK
jgi:cytochrome P450